MADKKSYGSPKEEALLKSISLVSPEQEFGCKINH